MQCSKLGFKFVHPPGDLMVIINTEALGYSASDSIFNTCLSLFTYMYSVSVHILTLIVPCIML